MDQHPPDRRRRTRELDELLEHARPRLRRLLQKRRIPEQDVDDLVQQILIGLLDRWERIANTDAWLAGAAHKKSQMYWRTRSRRIYDSFDDRDLEWLAEPRGPGQERDVVRSDLAVLAARLPERYRSVLRLRYGLGYAPREVAEELGYRASSIGKITARSLAALGRELVAAGYLTSAAAAPPGPPA